VAGAKRPAGYVLDGVSYARLLTSGGRERLDREAIYWHFPGYLGAGPGQWRTLPVSVVRRGDWKLMEFLEDGRLELYNTREDIGEKNNLASKMPEKVRQMQEDLHRWRAAVGARMPGPNTNRVEAPAVPSKKRAVRRQSAPE